MALESKLARHVKLRALRALIAVSQEGSIARAAKTLALSQPAVSNTIEELERGVGARLLDRSNQGVELTLAGNALLRRAITVLDELRGADQEIANLSDPAAGELRLVAGPAGAAGFLPHVLLHLARAFPRIRTVLIEATRWDALPALRARDADLGIGRIPRNRDGNDAKDIVFEPLFEERLFVVAGREHALARRRRVDIRTLSTERWIMPAGGTLAGDLVATEFDRLGLDISEVAIRTDSIPLRSALLQSGRYVTVLPGSMLAYGRAREELVVLPVDLAGATRTMGIACLRGRTLPPVYQPFFACARKAALRMRRFEPYRGSGRRKTPPDVVDA